LNNEFIVSKINKASPNFLNNVNENNITQSGLNSLPSNLIARFKKNHSLINDSGFVSSVKKTWHTKKFSSPQSENQFFEVFKRVITKMDHDLRLENMIWDGNFDAANRIFNKASVGKKSQLQNRIRILRASSLNEVQSIVNSLKNRNSQEYQTSIFDAIRWCEYNKIDNKKFEFLSQASNFKNLNQHWAKLFKQSRRELLSSNNPKFIQLAYYSASNHSEKPRTTDFVEAEFLAGFIAFKFLGQNQKAIEHFYQSYKNAENHNRISRGAYWIGLVLRKGGGTRSSFFDSKQLNEPLYWFSIGSRNFTSFYGQLCAFEIDQNSNPIQKYLAQIDSKSISNVKNHQLFSYYYYSLLTKNFDLSSKIAKIFTLSLRSKSEIAAIAQLANILNMPLVSIHIGNVAKKHLNLTLIEALYPTPHYNNLKYNKALVYSIIHKESAFDHKVSGLAGEFGLMQIMPDTASKLSKQLGVHINGRNLYDPHLNSLLGSQYIKNLQNRFNGFSLLSIGAYNAGENVVERWISSYGDPRNSRSHYDIVSWIESTSFKTTRYYMQTVMANYLIYQTILNSEHKSNLGKMLFH
jgi:soluble lytic murein transglycosylase